MKYLVNRRLVGRPLTPADRISRPYQARSLCAVECTCGASSLALIFSCPHAHTYSALRVRKERIAINKIYQLAD